MRKGTYCNNQKQWNSINCLIFHHEWKYKAEGYNINDKNVNKERENIPEVNSEIPKIEKVDNIIEAEKIMQEIFLTRENQQKAYQKFGNLEGIAQQYLFYWKREA